MEGDLGSKGEKTLDGRILPPRSVIIGNDIDVSEVVKVLIKYYFPHAKVIYDPTCGEENYQFNDWILQEEYQKKYDYIASDIKRTKWSMFQADVFKLPLRDNSVDIIVYDPPYLPYPRTDSRGEDYDIATISSPLKILEFYSGKIFKEFYRICRQGIIVKCADFYYPVNTNNFYPILAYVCPKIMSLFKIVAIHIYRYFHQMTTLLQYRLSKITLKHRRAFTVHSYYIVAYKRKLKMIENKKEKVYQDLITNYM